MGVLREAEIASATKSASHRAIIDAKAERAVQYPADATHPIAAPAPTASPAPVHGAEAARAVVNPTPAPSRGQSRQPFQHAVATAPPRPRAETHIQGKSPRPERTVMQPKTIFPHFWRRKQDEDTRAKSTITEAPVNKPNTQEPTPSGPRGELLNYEDIYRAAGIISLGSGYGIHKVVDMLNKDRIRDLSNDAKRACVLMALDAAGISADELLTDATRPPECADILRDRPEQTTGRLRGPEGEGEHPHRGRNGKDPDSLRPARTSESRPGGEGKRSAPQLANGHAA